MLLLLLCLSDGIQQMDIILSAYFKFFGEIFYLLSVDESSADPAFYLQQQRLLAFVCLQPLSKGCDAAVTNFLLIL